MISSTLGVPKRQTVPRKKRFFVGRYLRAN
jgi:hypothetical protein